MLRTATALVLCLLLAFAFSTTALAADGYWVTSPTRDVLQETDEGLVDDVTVPTTVSHRLEDASLRLEAPEVTTRVD